MLPKKRYTEFNIPIEGRIGKRNSYMHRAWSETEAGQVILLEEDLRLGAALPEAAIERVASEILALGKQINDARLHEFIHDVVQCQPSNAQATPSRIQAMEVHAEASSNTSLAALIPDSTAPSIHACFSEVCSPAKWIRSWHFHTFSKSSFS
jgi:hypothetical protein